MSFFESRFQLGSVDGECRSYEEGEGELLGEETMITDDMSGGARV